MEPVVLVPDFKEQNLVLGRQTAKENKEVFPLTVHVCKANGRLASDGWSLLHSAKCTGCRALKRGTSEYNLLGDAWVTDTLERAPKKANTSRADETMEERVLWECSHAFVYHQPIHIHASQMSGNQMQPLQRLPKNLQACVVGRAGVWSTNEDEAVQEGTLPQTWATGYLFRVPGAVAQKPLQLVTLYSPCKRLRVEPPAGTCAESLAVALAESSQPSASASGIQPGRFESREEYYARGAGWGNPKSERSGLQEILFGQMAYVLQNFDAASDILSLCARILDPDGSKLKGECCPVPGRDTMRRTLIKLDLFLMLNRRVFHSPRDPGHYVHRFLSSDASPQAHQNFFCTIEDIVRQPRIFHASQQFNAFQSSFEVERRSLPALTLGKGEASTAQKARLLLHCACLEYGQDNLKTWRQQVVSCLSDQGTERGLPSFPINIDGELGDFVQALSRGAQQGLEDVPVLFPRSLSIPGFLHIIFNGLEESLEQIDEWKLMERQLQAACHVVSDPSSQSVLLEKLYKDAPSHERGAIEAFKTKLLSWRWQTLQEVVQQWFAVYGSLKERWDPSIFGDSTNKYVDVVGEALNSSWHFAFLCWLRMFTSCVGREATWFEGCFCHDNVLSAHPNRWSRRKAMREAGCPEGNCVWQGRRLPALALGHGAGLCQRVQNASSVEYTAVLLTCDRSESCRLSEIDFLGKTRFCQTMEQKLAPFTSLPYILVGAFGEYCGYPLASGKKAVRDAFEQFGNARPMERDAISSFFLETNAAVSGQLRDFSERPDTSLHDYPDAFLLVRAHAFALCAERHTEGEHARVKFHAQRGYRFAGPVMVAARKRRAEIQDMIKNHMQWLAQHWQTHSLFVILLEHVLPKATVMSLSFSQRCKRVYACGAEDHFADVSKWEKEAATFQKALKNVQLSLEDAFQKLSGETMQIVYFMKHYLPAGSFVSLPASLWKDATCPIPSEETAAEREWTPLQLEVALMSAKLSSSQGLRGHVFFSVVDAYPEAKVVVKTRTVPRNHASLVHVSCFPDVVWQEDHVVNVHMHGREARALELATLATHANFDLFCKEATVWRATCSELHVNLVPALTSSSEPLYLPDVLLDEDGLADLLGHDAREERAIELYTKGRDNLSLSVGMQDRPLSVEERSTVMALVQQKALSADAGVGLWDLEYFNTSAMDHLRSLNIIACSCDSLGDERWWLTDALRISPSMTLSDPNPLLERAHSHGSSVGKAKRSCKLAFVLALLQEGWTMKKWKRDITWHQRGKAKVFCDQVWKRPEAYFKALLLSDVIFERPGSLKQIHHMAPASYYLDLLVATDTTSFKKLKDAGCLNYKSKAKPRGSKAKPLAIMDEPQEEGGVLQMPDEALALDRVECKEPTMKAAYILYDRFTHASGHLRCFTACVHHEQCRRYTFVKNHDSKAHAESWLLAWNRMGSSCGTAAEHKLQDPTRQQVEQMLRIQAHS